MCVYTVKNFELNISKRLTLGTLLLLMQNQSIVFNPGIVAKSISKAQNVLTGFSMPYKYPKIFQMQFLLFVLRKQIASLWLSLQLRRFIVMKYGEKKNLRENKFYAVLRKTAMINIDLLSHIYGTYYVEIDVICMPQIQKYQLYTRAWYNFERHC